MCFLKSNLVQRGFFFQTILQIHIQATLKYTAALKTQYKIQRNAINIHWISFSFGLEFRIFFQEFNYWLCPFCIKAHSFLCGSTLVEKGNSMLSEAAKLFAWEHSKETFMLFLETDLCISNLECMVSWIVLFKYSLRLYKLNYLFSFLTNFTLDNQKSKQRNKKEYDINLEQQ